MGILSARSLSQALSQARHVGLVEEAFVIGDVSVVVRNLRPDQYDSIFKDCQGLSDVEYLNAWQSAHVCRAICELNGQDLRDVRYIEDEEPDPKRNGQMRPVKHELHAWLLKNIVSTWSREVVYICYRKVADAIEGAEKRAQEGVTFRVDDESPEDKFRRLISEIKDVEGNVPERILDAVLKEHGYMRRATIEEIEAVEKKFAKVAEKVDQIEPAPADPAPQEVPAAKVAEVDPAQRAQAGPPSPERMAQLLRQRQPMNQQPAAVPVPQASSEQVPVVAGPSQAPLPAQAVPQAALAGRTAEHAALEAAHLNLPPGTPAPVNLQPQATVPEVRLGSGVKLDPAAAQAIVDTPPVGGINPRFRPPPR